MKKTAVKNLSDKLRRKLEKILAVDEEALKNKIAEIRYEYRDCGESCIEYNCKKYEEKYDFNVYLYISTIDKLIYIINILKELEFKECRVFMETNDIYGFAPRYIIIDYKRKEYCFEDGQYNWHYLTDSLHHLNYSQAK